MSLSTQNIKFTLKKLITGLVYNYIFIIKKNNSRVSTERSREKLDFLKNGPK